MRSRVVGWCLVALLGAACNGNGLDGDGLGWGDELATRQAAITVDHETVLTFPADWNELTANLPVMAGGSVKVVYDPSRLPNCRAWTHGFPAWSLLFWHQVDGLEPQYTALAWEDTMMTATIDVPEDAGELTLWFQNNDVYGCNEYDSNLGDNYVYEVSMPAEPTALLFADDWSESADGDVVQGGQVRLVYAPQRLESCRHTVNGARAWNIFASWVFSPGGEGGTVALYDGDLYAGADAIAEPLIAVPDDATELQLWFSNSDSTGCVSWDSDYGTNYSFPVVAPGGGPAVGWAGDWDFVKFHNYAEHLGDVDPAYYFDNWEGVPLASYVEVQVWIPGLTDQSYATNGEAQAAAEAAVVAEAMTDALDDGSGWGAYPLDFERQQGNNFVYSFRIAELRWQIYGYEIPDGLYQYYARFSTDAGGSWYEVGNEDGQTRRFVVAPELDCSLFPDNKPESCPQDATVGWAGNWGSYRTHACYHQDALEDPVTFTKSACGHDCMVITAEVYVPGVTDSGAQPSALQAEVVTDIGYQGGPLSEPATYPLVYDGVVGNNFRYRWDVSMHVSLADRDDYTYAFRFSGDGGQSWYTIGQGDGPDGGDPRNLLVRLDSTDVDEVLYCDDLELWEGQSAHSPYCVEYQVAADYDANFCELWVNALGLGNWSHNGTTLEWLETYIHVGPQDGQVRNVGMLVSVDDGQGGLNELTSMGSEIEPGYYKTGFTFTHTGPGSPGTTHNVDSFAFFVDVERSNGDVERLWQSGGGANYTIDAAFAVDGWVVSLGSGSVEYADESVGLFDQKKACGQ